MLTWVVAALVISLRRQGTRIPLVHWAAPSLISEPWVSVMDPVSKRMQSILLVCDVGACMYIGACVCPGTHRWRTETKFGIP